MQLDLVCVGRLKERYWKEAAAEYLKRLGPYARVVMTEIADRDVTADEPRAIAAESADILRALAPSAHVVALDIEGTARTSQGIADWLDARALGGQSRIALVIGGAAGLHADVFARADERLSLGPLTLPHQLARVVLLEQLYRSFRISRGEPYHR